ncbi:MAG: hypothetical protein LBP30_02695 [Clostridiales Family XIII bacterium]|jgi:hypothetical protein|nr:hypothetical protein [Clostridiales Family XIII bacterium]
MNRPSEQELKSFSAYYKQDTDFAAYARLLQSKWRKGKGYPIGKSQNGTIYGNYVEEEFARKRGCNFLTQKIWDIARKEMEMAKTRGGLYQEYRFICNLLTSQSMCFNLFGEFFEEKNTLLNIFNELKPGLMDKITEIRFEYPYRRADKKYLGDRTAFDVFIEYEKDGEKSFLGIEGKYAEALREESMAQSEINYENHIQYKQITESCGLFKPEIINEIKKPPYSQMWRDHLLSISLKNSESKYNNGYFVYLYPFNNLECRTGIKNYLLFLQDPEKSVFEIYVEDLIRAIQKNVNKDWTNELCDRYIKGL